MGGLLNNLMGTSQQAQAAAGMSSLIPASQAVPSATPDDHNGLVEYSGPQPFEYSSAQSIPGYTPAVTPVSESGRYALPRQFEQPIQRAGLHDSSAPIQPQAGPSPETGKPKPENFLDAEDREKINQGSPFDKLPLAQLKQIYAAIAS